MSATFHIEEELINRMVQGDELAFRKVYDYYKGKIFAYAFKHTKTKESATEVVQDVFVKLWMARTGIDTGNNFEAYLIRIAQNHIFNLMRDAARDKEKQSKVFQYIKHIQDNPEEELLAKELNKAYQEAIQQLPPQKKIIYRLKKEQALSYSDIALQLNISPLTAKKHMAEAVKQIREYIRLHDGINALVMAYYLYEHLK